MKEKNQSDFPYNFNKYYSTLTTLEERKPFPQIKPLWLAIIGILLGILLAVAAYTIGRALRPTPVLRGAMLYPPVPAVDFRLQCVDGRNYSLYDFHEMPILLAFSCSNCSQSRALMNTLAETNQLLADEDRQVRMMIISVDTNEDSFPEFVDFIESYNRGFMGLSGDQKEIRDLARSYGIFFQSEPEKNGGIEITPLILLVDGNGFWRAIYPLSMAANDIAADINILLAEER